jgi:hypothetical protein
MFVAPRVCCLATADDRAGSGAGPEVQNLVSLFMAPLI